MKIKTFEEFEKVNEEALPKAMLDDIGNKNAMKSWSKKDPSVEYNITTEEPISITTTDDVELAKLKMIFYKYDIKFDVKEFQLN